MRYFLIVLSFVIDLRAETIDEAYKRLFPHGAYVLQLRPKIENSNRIILKPVRLENQYSPVLERQYIYYETYFATQGGGRLIINAKWEAREYAVFGSKVFLSEKKGPEFFVKYILSQDFHVLSKRNMDFLAIAKVVKTPPEHLVPAFLRCEGVL